MDSITHALVGAVLAQTGLKRRTALAVPTLVIAASLPDIDIVSGLWLTSIEQLGFRRGITHGPLGTLLLPPLLCALMLGWDALRRRGAPDRPAVHRGWLLALAYIGWASHLLLDIPNNYGVRFGVPFAETWTYGDSLFIIDVWLWALMIAALLIGWRAERRGAAAWTRPARTAVTIGLAYIALNSWITASAEAQAAKLLAAAGVSDALVVASPVPALFWQRDIMWRTPTLYGGGMAAVGQGVRVSPAGQPHRASDPRIAALAATNREVAAFLRWSRMPVAEFARDGTLTLTDQRYRHPLAIARFRLVAKQGS